MVSGPAVPAGGWTIFNVEGMGTVSATFGFFCEGGMEGLEPGLTTRTMMTAITTSGTTMALTLPASLSRLARNSAARRSAARCCDSALRCALDWLPLVIGGSI
jgi:hypothetical protein